MIRKRALQAVIMAGLIAATTFGAVGTAEALPKQCGQITQQYSNEFALADSWYYMANFYSGSNYDAAKYNYAVNQYFVHEGRGYAAKNRAKKAGC